jgi:hypothetical protein
MQQPLRHITAAAHTSVTTVSPSRLACFNCAARGVSSSNPDTFVLVRCSCLDPGLGRWFGPYRCSTAQAVKHARTMQCVLEAYWHRKVRATCTAAVTQAAVRWKKGSFAESGTQQRVHWTAGDTASAYQALFVQCQGTVHQNCGLRARACCECLSLAHNGNEAAAAADVQVGCSVPAAGAAAAVVA